MQTANANSDPTQGGIYLKSCALPSGNPKGPIPRGDEIGEIGLPTKENSSLGVGAI